MRVANNASLPYLYSPSLGFKVALDAINAN